MYFYVKFYEKDNELHEIYFSVQLGGLKEAKALGENMNTSDENKNITTLHYVVNFQNFTILQ